MLSHFSFSFLKVLEIFTLSLKGFLPDIVFLHLLNKLSLYVLLPDYFISLLLVYLCELFDCLVQDDLFVVFEGCVDLTFVSNFTDRSHLFLVLMSTLDCKSINKIFTVKFLIVFQVFIS